MIFQTFQQLQPKQVGDEWVANLVRRYDVEANSPEHAIAQAKEWNLFRHARGMGRSPIVCEFVPPENSQTASPGHSMGALLSGHRAGGNT